VTGEILPARIDAADALRCFERRRFGNLFGLMPYRPAKVGPDGRPSSLELVWMPVYAFQFSMIFQGKPVQSWVSVDASFGGFALLGRMGELVEAAPEGEVFSPVLSTEYAEGLAREGVVRYIMRKRGAKPGVDGIVARKIFHTPVWVYYFRTFGDKLDLAVLDAYSGDTMGGLVRRAIVDAFIAKGKKAAGAGTG